MESPPASPLNDARTKPPPQTEEEDRSAPTPILTGLPAPYDAILRTIRQEHQLLVKSEEVLKPSAVEIMRLNHAMETMMLQIVFDLNQEVTRLKGELALSQLTLKQANMLDSLTKDLDKMRQEATQQAAAVQTLQHSVQSLEGTLQNAQARRR